MSPLVKEAKSRASPATKIARQETTSSAVENPTASVIDQQQTAGPPSVVEKSTSSISPEPLINSRQNSGLSSSVEDQLRKQITGLEDEICQLKINQDPSRELVKHAFREALAQLRKKNLNLRIDLKTARKKHQALESEHDRCKKQMEKAIIRNLSTSLNHSKGESASPGQATEGAIPAASLPPKQSVRDTICLILVIPPALFTLVLLAAQVEAYLSKPTSSANIQ